VKVGQARGEDEHGRERDRSVDRNMVEHTEIRRRGDLPQEGVKLSVQIRCLSSGYKVQNELRSGGKTCEWTRGM